MPLDLMQTLRAFQESRALLTAVELDVFRAVGEGATAGEVSVRIGASERGTEALLHALVSLEALSKSPAGVFRRTPASEMFRDARAGLMHVVNLWNTWSTLSEAVRAGTAVRPPGVEQHDRSWTRDFIAAMHNIARTNAAAVVRLAGARGARRLLDIGGGSGAYAIAFAEQEPELRAEVFDLPPVVPIAEQHIREAGLAGRVTTREGDLRRDEFGAGYDLLLLSAICHMLGPDENQDLFRRCFNALEPAGRLVIRDFILEPGRTAPRQAALFALNMLVGTRSGSTYTEQEYRDWLRAAGFANVERPDPGGDVLVVMR